MEDKISLKELFQIVKSRFSLIISVTLVVVIITAVISFFILTPVYQSSTQLLVNQTQNNQSLYNENQVQTNLQLVNTYSVIIKSPAVLDLVIKDLNLKMSEGELNQDITVESETNSQVVNITVQNTDPKQAALIANKTAEVFKNQIINIMKVDNVTILAKADVVKKQAPIKPRPSLNIMIALVVGLMIGIALAFIIDYFNNMIKTEQDVEKALGLPILGVITTFEDSKETGKGLAKYKRVGSETVGSK
jgi:capsular polysaccharide biosynthesis protein